MAWNACIPQTADFYSYRANALHRDESKRNRDGAHRMALCFTHEAMLFSTQNIHLEKSLRYLISFSFHTIPKVIVDTIILKSFIFYSDEIKKDEKLINAYEDILLALTEIRNEKAAVLLDEFRIH